MIALTTMLRALRRRILTPNESATKLDVRGFNIKDAESRQRLETVGRIFLTGYGYAAEARSTAEAEGRLERIPPEFRGFAYEGAGMGFAVRDGLPVGGSRHFVDFLTGRAAEHIYMVYIGLGWAMARLPRFRWPNTDALDPLLRWMVLDGYGFHQAYFRTQRYVHQQYQEPGFPWPAGESYALRVIDQGIGRAMWFVAGTDSDLVATMIERFSAHRRGDLYSGAGLAATYAGGVDESELQRFRERAGEHRSRVAQGSAFAAKARVRAGLLTPHTSLATQVLCETTPEKAAQITDDVLPADPTDGQALTYEAWRQGIAERLVPGKV